MAINWKGEQISTKQGQKDANQMTEEQWLTKGKEQYSCCSLNLTDSLRRSIKEKWHFYHRRQEFPILSDDLSAKARCWCKGKCQNEISIYICKSIYAGADDAPT